MQGEPGPSGSSPCAGLPGFIACCAVVCMAGSPPAAKWPALHAYACRVQEGLLPTHIERLKQEHLSVPDEAPSMQQTHGQVGSAARSSVGITWKLASYGTTGSGAAWLCAARVPTDVTHPACTPAGSITSTACSALRPARCGPHRLLHGVLAFRMSAGPHTTSATLLVHGYWYCSSYLLLSFHF